MTRYVISDHHFNHEKIIEKTDRPFDNQVDMHGQMQRCWKSVVEDDDVVLYGGDFALAPRETTIKWIERLPGSFLYLTGNHDTNLKPEKMPIPVIESTVITHGGYEFWYTHRPQDVPSDWSGWVLHGHTHNNDPFIDYDSRHVNVSVEAVDYTPIPIPQLTKALSAMQEGDQAKTLSDSPIIHHQWYQNINKNL